MSHGYVVGKGLSSLVPQKAACTGLVRVGEEEFITVPYAAYDDPFGDIVGVELIAPDGTKKTMKGTRKGVHILPRGTGDWLVVEGWMTGLALAGLLRQYDLPHRVAVAGGKGKMEEAAKHLPNARCIYEEDGHGTPDGELSFPCTEQGNDAADWYFNKPTVELFIQQLINN
jgi:phage/plasmid primase-like uncharacterized protein